MTDSFRALVATQAGDRQEIGFTTWTEAELPAGDVTVGHRVSHCGRDLNPGYVIAAPVGASA